jgi:hypothetical protein
LDMSQIPSRFRERVKGYVLELLNHEPLTWEQLLSRCLNCDPSVLMNVCHELEESNCVSKTHDGGSTVYFRSTPEKKNLGRNSFLEGKASGSATLRNRISKSELERHVKLIAKQIHESLPEASPVYFQWWFSESTYLSLVEFLLNLSRPKTTSAFLGAPTLGASFSEFSTGPVHILDIDEVILNAIRPYCSKLMVASRYDASDDIDKSLRGSFQLVFADPPWARSMLSTFLMRGAALLAQGGTLAISFPQLFTRPTAESERSVFLRLASSLGLSLNYVLKSFTQYSIPLFEYYAYRNHGIILKEPWRRGDVFIFTKTRPIPLHVENVGDKSGTWDQYFHNKCRLFLKRDACHEDGSPGVEPVPGLINLGYASTSSRTRPWKSASLVSTRNQLARAYGRRKLSIVLNRVLKENRGKRDIVKYFHSQISQEATKVVLEMLSIGASNS